MENHPPKYALKFLRWFCKEEFLEEIEGNLIELFEKQAEESPRRARRVFIWQVLLHFRPDFIKSLNFLHLFIHPDMLKHYFKITWRSLLKQKLYSFINIGGLAIGLACFILIFLYVYHERSYDQFYENSDQIYRVFQRMQGNEYKGTEFYGYTTVGLAPTLIKDFPEVISATTIRDQQALLSIEEDHFYENGLRVDSRFFEVFKHPLLLGNPKTALENAESIILTESLAKKMFGPRNPMGETLFFQNRKAFTVTGVMQDLPANSSLQFTFMTPMLSSSQYVRELKEDQWNNNDYYTFFTLAPQANSQNLQGKFPAFLDKYMKKNEDFPFKISYLVQPLSELHFENKINFDIGSKGNARYTALLFLIAILILLLACVNYMNLAIARSIKRAGEVGLRKVIGAMRKQLIGQFLGESVLIAFLGLLLAFGIIYFLSPVFEYLLSKPINIDLFNNVLLIPGLLLLVIVVGILSGSYPAFLMSSLRPIQVLKGRTEGRFSDLKIQRFLLIGQYATAIILIISSLVIYLQFQFIQKKELGFNKEQIITIPVQDFKIREKYSELKNEWERNPNILSVTATSELPINVTSGTTLRQNNETLKEDLNIYRARVDEDYLDVFEIELIAGRDFSTEFKTDIQNARIINESAAKAFGWTPEEAVGKPLREISERTIIGVVKDFHMHSMHTEIAPLMLMMRNHYFEYMAVKVRPDNLKQTISMIEKGIKGLSPYPFEYSFLDEKYNQLYQEDLKIGELFGFFTILSILIASLGLFGLAAFVAKQKTKEIGIRKVLGASVQGIVGMLSADFLKMALLGYLMAIPIAWYVMDQWLNDFAYRINMEWWMFGLAGILALIIAFVTVSSQSLKAALSNPVEALKNE